MATVFPINAKRASVLGIKAYPNLAALPQQVDLAVIVTPAPTVPGLVAECVQAGVKGAIIISAGFKEIGAEGLKYVYPGRTRYAKPTTPLKLLLATKQGLSISRG